MRKVTLTSGLSLLLLSAAACDDNESNTGPQLMNDGGVLDGATLDPDGDRGNPPATPGDDSGTGPQMPEPDADVRPGSDIPTTPTSNILGADITTEAASTTAEALQLVSSHLALEPSGDEYFMQWFGVIANRGDIPLCGVQAEVDFLAGSSLALEAYGFAKAPPHQTISNSAVSSACIPPGGLGFVYDNGFESSFLNIQSITKIHAKLAGSDYDAYAHPSAPIFDSIQEAPGFGPDSYRVTGSLRAVAPIYNIGIEVYLMDENWLVFDRLIDTNLDSLTTGQTWAFETTTTDVRAFDTLHPFASFIDGFPSSAPQLKSADPEREHTDRVNSNRVRHDAQR